jgi:hypothetical protein
MSQLSITTVYALLNKTDSSSVGIKHDKHHWSYWRFNRAPVQHAIAAVCLRTVQQRVCMTEIGIAVDVYRPYLTRVDDLT